MPRKPILYSSLHPYHITARSNNRDWFDLPKDYCFEVFCDVLKKVIENYHFQLHAFVLMDNHFHMIISTPNSNISSGMRYFMTETARGLRVKSKRTNHVYGGRYKPCLISHAAYYAACIKYVYRNPIKAGLVEEVERYRFSTISDQTNKLDCLTSEPSHGHAELLPNLPCQRLKWYNQVMSELESLGIQQALRRRNFKLSQQHKTGKHIQLTTPY